MESEILKNLHPALSIAWDEMGDCGKPASEEDIQALLAAFPNTPPDYLDIIRQLEIVSLNTLPHLEFYFSLFLLCPADVLAWRNWYPYLQESMPGVFFFATDGDWSFLVSENDGRHGVFKVQTSGPDWAFTEYLSPSIRELLCDGLGWARS